MLYNSIESLLAEHSKTWTDFLFETRLSPDIINKSINNECTE